MQGWTPDFIPKLTADVVAAGIIDRIIPIAGAEAIRRSADLARKEGIYVGITAGATFAGALRMCAEAPEAHGRDRLRGWPYRTRTSMRKVKNHRLELSAMFGFICAGGDRRVDAGE
jgi:cysteine synthase